MEPGLDCIREDARARVGIGEASELVRIEARLLREREYFTAARIERHDESAARVGRSDPVGERLLGFGLHRDVDRQGDVTAGGRVAIEPRTEQEFAPRVSFDSDAARPTE